MNYRFWDFILAFNSGLFAMLIGIWFYMTFNFPIGEYINGFYWGGILGIFIFIIIFNIYSFFKDNVRERY
jgi:hypothetical protein